MSPNDTISISVAVMDNKKEYEDEIMTCPLPMDNAGKEVPALLGVKDHSLATPAGMAVSPDGTTLFVAAFGSSRIGVLDTQKLADDMLDPMADSANYIPVTGGGPTGLVLDAARNRLYVLTRFDDAISVIDGVRIGDVSRLCSDSR